MKVIKKIFVLLEKIFTLYLKVLFMSNTKEQLAEIKDLMERSTRFLSLSGLSGISAGITALIGASIAFFYLNYNIRYFDIDTYFTAGLYKKVFDSLQFLILDAVCILVIAISFAAFFTIRKTKKAGQKVWNSTSKRLLFQLLVPLATGGVFCLLLLFHHLVFLIAPATLLFYGLALFNAGKYTLREIQWLGMSEIALGLIGTWFVGYGLLFWSIGFGLLHIVYGIGMFLKYDKNK